MTTGVTSPLQPYLPRLVLDWQQTMPDALVREIDGSMVFADVSGFTKMSERLGRQGKVGAEEVSDVIGDTFGTLLAEAYACGGSLIKFGGDALLLFFEGDDHAFRAVAAAHGMRAELRRVGTFSTTVGRVTLRMSVGAHTGLFHFFLVGGSHRELIVAGPAATETVTMEGAASAGQILLSPALTATLPGANRGRPLGPGVLLVGSPPDVERTEIHREAVTFDLEPFVPVALRETVLEGEVEPEHRSVTIAFIHYGGFDDLVLREGPAAAAGALDALVRSAQRAVDARGVAFLASDIAPDGGKIILTAGAPVVTGADEEQMLLAVREIIAGDSGLPLHVGVNKGPVFAGAIGPSYRRTYTVMGDAVNLAARLMAKADTGEIIATAAVIDASRTIFDTTELEPFLVKGKKKPITALTVGEAKGSRTTIAEAGLPLLGRDAELEALLAAWKSAQGGEGHVVELSGEPGMGKSRLLEEFLQRAGGPNVIRSECRLYQSATAYFPFRALLRSAFGLEGLDDDASVSALAALVDERAPALRPWLSLIATPLDLEVEPSPDVHALENEFRRTRLEEVVTALVVAVASEPTVVVVEDTHWLDEPSRGLLARVTAGLRASPWLLILSARAGEDGYASADEGDMLVRIELEPLGIEQATELIHAATDDAPLMPHQARELADRAAGNPLFLIELLDALRRGDDVETMPGSVEGFIHARIDRLPTVARRQLRALSVLGVGFSVEHAEVALAGGESQQVARAIRSLGDFLSVDRTGWIQFRHALIRDAAYEGLPYRRRQHLHAQVGDSIVAAAGDNPEDAAELLSLHYSYARRWLEAWTYSRVAGDRARGVYANLEAARFYERALVAVARVDGVDAIQPATVAMQLSEVREHAGLFTDALEALRRARRSSGKSPVLLAELHLRRAQVLIRTGSLASAYRETTRGYRLAEREAGQEAARVRARLTGLSANIRLISGRPGDARALAERAALLAEAAGDLAELAHAYTVLDNACLDLGRAEEAVYARRAVEIYESLGDSRGVGVSENDIGVRAYAEGRWDDAVAAYQRAQDAYRRAGNEVHAVAAAGNIGEVLVSQGRFVEADALLGEAARVLRAHGLVGPALFAEIQRGRVRLALGEFAAAADGLEATREEAIALGIRVLSLEAAITLADVARGVGDMERSLEILDAEEASVGELAAAFSAALARARSETLLAAGRHDEAAAVVSVGLVSADATDGSYDRARLLALEARIARARGAGRAAEALEESARLFQRLGVIALPSR